MAIIEKTPLSEVQKLRLINLLEINHTIREANLKVIKDTCVRAIEVKYEPNEECEEETIYPTEENMDWILNGLTLERGN